MAVSATGQIMLSSTVQLREPTIMGSTRNLRFVKFCNGEIMGRKIELKAGGAISNCCTKNVIRQNISMSLTADVAAESKLRNVDLEKRDPSTVVAIILGGGAGTRLFPLTKRRAKPAVPIGGAYRLIDVPMSNCINSGINKVYILTQFNSASLNRHIARAYNSGTGVTFGDGYVEVLAATQTPGEQGKKWFQGTADAVRQFHWLFEDARSKDIEDVLILSGDHLYRMDYMDFVQNHRESGADITLSCLPMDDSRASDFGLMKIDNKGRVLSFSEKPIRLALIDFLRGLVEFDPAKRWSPFQASKHPFVTGEPFTHPYRPSPETPHIPVVQNIKVDNHPGGGHWFAAGLSPNVAGKNRASLYSSPHFQMAQHPPANSYGSVGSHGSYNDSVGLGSSYGSYGESSNMFAYYSPIGPSGMNMHSQGGMSMLGNSPDARRRVKYQPGNGLGVSPSGGNFAPLPLGASPSQFTPPSSYSQISVGSPGHFGPTSPARGASHGSPLGKTAAVSQFNRRKNWGHSVSPQTQETTFSSHWHGQYPDSSSQAEGTSQAPGSSPSYLHSNINPGNWKQRGSGGASANQNIPSKIMPGANKNSQSTELIHDNVETGLSLPDPGDWDPNYSDELLLQEGGSDESSLTTEFGRSMNLGSTEPWSGFGRINGPGQTFSNVEMGSPPGHDLQAAYMHSMSKPFHLMPHILQNSPSRFGHQPVQRFTHGRPPHGNDWNQIKIQAPSGFSNVGPRSPRNASFTSSMTWGRRMNPPISSIPPISNMPPTSRSRKDYARID